MTTTDPDQIRREIEHTRNELSEDVNALTYKASPRRMVSDRMEQARGGLRGVKERIMGTAAEAGDRVSSAASNVGETAAAAPRLVREQTQGSPLAAGLVAFGVGVVISSLLPPTRTEQRVSGQVKEKAAEYTDEVKEQARQVGQEVKEHLREPARQAAESVKSTAAEAADTVKDEGRVAAQDVRYQAQQARDNVTDR
jgi:ElaB/YqjD/DUF883 family membrane-anchored ribosome-binding protein